MGQANVQLELLCSCVYPGVESSMNYILLIVLAEVLRLQNTGYDSICTSD